MRKNCKRLLQRLVELQKKKREKKAGEIKKTGRQRENVLVLSKMEITSQGGKKKSHSLKCAKTLMISQFLLIGCEQRKSRELLFLCVKSK